MGYIGKTSPVTGYLKLDGSNTATKFNTPYAQVVTVAKSGGDYTTITAALASITDAATGKRYLIKVMPGTYTEAITMKEYVDIDGSGVNDAIITMADTTIVAGASNTRLSNLKLLETGATGTRSCYLANAANVNNIILESVNCSLTGTAGGGTSSCGINILSFGATSYTNIHINNCVITGDITTRNRGIVFANNAASNISNCYITNCKIYTMYSGISYYGSANTTARVQLLVVKNNYINTGTEDFLVQFSSSTANAKLDVDSYNNTYFLKVRLLTNAATHTLTFNSYGDVVGSVVKSAGGGTETFNSYGSIVGNIGDFDEGITATATGDISIVSSKDIALVSGRKLIFDH